MRLDITTDFKLKGISPNSIALMQRIGSMLTRNIIARTQFLNVDPSGKSFRKYSIQYAEFKKKKGGSGNIVNLKSVKTVSEHMVVSVDIVNVTGDYVEVGLTGINYDKANYNIWMDREFLGISKKDEKEMDKLIDDYMDEELIKL